MLQRKHLAIVRAALTYWDEEMAGADRRIYQHYLHSKDMEVEIEAVDVAQTRQFFNSAKLCEPEMLSVALPETSVILISTPE